MRLSVEVVTTTTAPKPAKQGTFSSLRHPAYRYLWVGTMFLSAGQWVQQVTLGWLLYDLTGSSVLLGALNELESGGCSAWMR